MNPRSTGILFLVAVALGAFVYLYEIQGEQGRREAEELTKRLFPGVEAEAIEWLAFQTSEGEPVRAERREKGWELVEPLVFPGDQFALDGLASTLAQLTSEAVYTEPQEAAVYGLDDPARELHFAAGGKEHGLRTGDEAPLGGNSYVAILGEKPVYTIPTYRVTSLRKSLLDLREKRLLRFDSATVRGIVASWPNGQVELALRDGAWQLTSPLEGPADAATVSDLLSDLAFLRADGFVDEPLPDAESGLDAPSYSVALELEPAAEDEEPRHLSVVFGRELPDETRLARAELPSLYRVPAARIDDFPRKVSAYRFRELAHFAASDARRVALRFRAPEGESLTVTASREEAGWSAGPEPMDPEKIAQLVDTLSNLKATDILAEHVGPAERAELELDPANVTLQVYGDKDELLAELHIGVVRGADGIVAQSGEDPLVYELPHELSEHIPVSLEALRNRFLVQEKENPEPPPADSAAEPPATTSEEP